MMKFSKLYSILILVTLITFSCGKKEEKSKDSVDNNDKKSDPSDSSDKNGGSYTSDLDTYKYPVSNSPVTDGLKVGDRLKLDLTISVTKTDGEKLVQFDSKDPKFRNQGGVVPFTVLTPEEASNNPRKDVKLLNERLLGASVDKKVELGIPYSIFRRQLASLVDSLSIDTTKDVTFDVIVKEANRFEGEISEDEQKNLEDFFTANNIKAEKTEEGLYYQIIKEGNEKKMDLQKHIVKVHYHGVRLKDGGKFDSSYDRGQPFSFSMSVIRGWQIGIPMLTEGTKARLFIPSKLGYGPRGSGAEIGPNETLIFDVEIVSITDK